MSINYFYKKGEVVSYQLPVISFSHSLGLQINFMTLAYQEHYTVEDYRLWQGDWELFDGMPYAMSPSPTVTHQKTSLAIASQFEQKRAKNAVQCSKCHVLIETDWQVSSDTIVRPDIMVLCKTIGERVSITPDLIVEVVSQSSIKRDEMMKFNLYQREGVKYYLLVYPDSKKIKLYRNEDKGFVAIADTQIPVFEIGKCSVDLDTTTIWLQ